jgi:hypothetical protein
MFSSPTYDSLSSMVLTVFLYSLSPFDREGKKTIDRSRKPHFDSPVIHHFITTFMLIWIEVKKIQKKLDNGYKIYKITGYHKKYDFVMTAG